MFKLQLNATFATLQLCPFIYIYDMHHVERILIEISRNGHFISLFSFLFLFDARQENTCFDFCCASTVNTNKNWFHDLTNIQIARVFPRSLKHEKLFLLCFLVLRCAAQNISWFWCSGAVAAGTKIIL